MSDVKEPVRGRLNLDNEMRDVVENIMLSLSHYSRHSIISNVSKNEFTRLEGQTICIC